MTEREKTDVTEMLNLATKVPKSKRAYLLGYMQGIVDANERKTKRRKNSENSVSVMG